MILRLSTYGVALVVAGVAFMTVLVMPWKFYDDPGVVEAIVALDGQWVDRPAPMFDLPDQLGVSHPLREFYGQVIFLNFWASFCEPCRREMPSMERLVRQYARDGLVMVAVSLDPEVEDVNRFMDAFLPGQRSAMTVLLDGSGQVAQAYGTELIPETYIIDRRGMIVARFVGEYDWTRPEIKQLIESLL
jgi:cytochrome c biogenesis protein CcmG, thiol:disulfide interchange protein DsbE